MIHLPFPPSVNALWRAVKGRNIKSAQYRAWEKEAGWSLNHNPSWIGHQNKPYHLDITLVRPDKRKRDLDNVGSKAISDLLVKHGITPDDSLMQSLTVRWADAAEGPTVRVTAGG